MTLRPLVEPSLFRSGYIVAMTICSNGWCATYYVNGEILANMDWDPKHGIIVHLQHNIFIDYRISAQSCRCVIQGHSTYPQLQHR